MIRAMVAGDWPAVAAIYAEGIATGNATFETEVRAWPRWDAAHLTDHRLVAVPDAAGPAGGAAGGADTGAGAAGGSPGGAGGSVAGWAAVSPVSARPAYAGVAEVSVYVAGAARGRGVGRALLAALIESTERGGIWTLQAGIFPENESSLALHRALGFRALGVRERPGRLAGRWRDVVVLERRSTVTGV